MFGNRKTKLLASLATGVMCAGSFIVGASPASASPAWRCGPLPAQTGQVNPYGQKAAVTADGIPHVFYQDSSTSDLKHAWRDSYHGWWVETLDGNSTAGGRTTHDIGSSVSAQVNGTTIVVSYNDSLNGDVRVAERTNGAWTYSVAYHATSESTRGGATAVGDFALGVFHTQGLGSGSPTASKLTFRMKGTSGWQEYPIDSRVDPSTSIASAYIGGSMHVWYGKPGASGTVLAHAWTRRNGTTGFLGFPTLDTRGGLVIDEVRREVLDGDGGPNGRIDSEVVGFAGVSVATQGANRELIHVYYSDHTRGKLRHAWWDTRQWTFETLDGDRNGGANGRTDGETGFAPTVVNLNGVMHVFYSRMFRSPDNGVRTGLRHAWHAGGWGYETLDGNATATVNRCTGSTTALVLGPTAATVVGNQIFTVSSTGWVNATLRFADYREP